ERHVYVIRNSRLDVSGSETRRRTVDIAARAVGSLIQTQGVGDLYQLLVCAQRDQTDVNFAFIPGSFQEISNEPFDIAYMRKLFDLGYRTARAGYPWSKTPPGYQTLVETTAERDSTSGR